MAAASTMVPKPASRTRQHDDGQAEIDLAAHSARPASRSSNFCLGALATMPTRIAVGGDER